MPEIKAFFLFIFLTVFSGLTLYAQYIAVSGMVVDEDRNEPIPFATVALLQSESNEILSGTTTDIDGKFELITENPSIKVQISFIGYHVKVVDAPPVANGKMDFGIVLIQSSALGLDEVEIVGERSEMEFKLDKRIFNVGKDIGSTGMGALELLDNVPSVNVDIEGQVSLRGNSGVQILINGKPSVLADPEGNALGSITADMIEQVEVITNPSAKYEAEGTAGIINIVLKKDEKRGLNGSISGNTGIPDNHSLGGSMNYRTENFNFFTQFGAGYRSLPRFRESENLDLTTGNKLVSEGTEYRNEAFYNITLGTDYYLTERDVITLSGSVAFEDEDQPSETEFSFFGENGQLESQWIRNETTEAANPKYQYDFNYTRAFADSEDHTLQFSSLGNFFGKESSSFFENTALLDAEVDPNQRTQTDFFERRFLFKLDYSKPISNRWSLEAGSLYEIKNVGNDFAVFNEVDGAFIPDPSFTNNFEYNQKVLGVYGTLGYEAKGWGVKGGLRVENTDLQTLLTNTNERNVQNFTDLFPSLHASYKWNERFSMQAGYSRRIYRPRLWDLNPFFNIRNNFNIRQGNPELLPEYSDSYEVTGILLFDKVSFNSSLYYLYTTEKIERVTFSEDNRNITKPINIGTQDKVGLELNGKYKAVDWLSFNGDFNWGYFSRNGDFEGQSFDFADDQWTTEVTAKFKFTNGIEFEVSGNYQSGFETIQGNQSGFSFANMGLRKKFLKGKIVANFAVRDIFNSRIQESFTTQPDFTAYDFSQRGTFYTLGLSFGFGKGEAMTYSGRRR
ncbi:MAG: outer membrane receptor protein involved in Fe transport [Cryomorphaceae bacterium]|jgi:outer membrane receptor protein involved in Fe transport